MKFVFAGDIHGSKYYCDLLLKRFEEEKADKLVLMGDLLYKDPQKEEPVDYDPEKVASALNAVSEKIIAVKGCTSPEKEKQLLSFDTENAVVSLEDGGRSLFVSHGDVFNEKNPPAELKKGDVLLCGFTHVPLFIESMEFTFINPGSVSLPMENSIHGSVTSENNIFFWKDIENGQRRGQCTLR